jgi:hypothetical protein
LVWRLNRSLVRCLHRIRSVGLFRPTVLCWCGGVGLDWRRIECGSSVRGLNGIRIVTTVSGSGGRRPGKGWQWTSCWCSVSVMCRGSGSSPRIRGCCRSRSSPRIRRNRTLRGKHVVAFLLIRIGTVTGRCLWRKEVVGGRRICLGRGTGWRATKIEEITSWVGRCSSRG